MRLNGQRVGDALLAPQWTAYDKRVQVQAYDVTGLVQQGPNALGALLGNGWYCGTVQCWPPEICLYGYEPRLKAQLKPGSRVVSHRFKMGDIKPERTIQVDNRDIYLWRI